MGVLGKGLYGLLLILFMVKTLEFHFYYPRKIDTLEYGMSLMIARKRNKTKRVRIPKWNLEDFYADCYGLTDSKNGVYIFGKNSPKTLIVTINHEVIHVIVEKIVRELASVQLDNIDDSEWL